MIHIYPSTKNLKKKEKTLVQCGPFDIKPELIPSTEAEMLGKFPDLVGTREHNQRKPSLQDT
jgi:hypothetical protein